MERHGDMRQPFECALFTLLGSVFLTGFIVPQVLGARYRHMQVLPHCDSMECYAPLLKRNCHYVSVIYPSKNCMCTVLKCDRQQTYIFPTPAPPISRLNAYPGRNLYSPRPFNYPKYPQLQPRINQPRSDPVSPSLGRSPPQSQPQPNAPARRWRSNISNQRHKVQNNIVSKRPGLNRGPVFYKFTPEKPLHDKLNGKRVEESWPTTPQPFKSSSFSFTWNVETLPTPAPLLPSPPPLPTKETEYLASRRRIVEDTWKPRQRNVRLQASTPAIRPNPPGRDKGIQELKKRLLGYSSERYSYPVTTTTPPESPFQRRFSDAPLMFDKDEVQGRFRDEKSGDYGQNWITWKPGSVEDIDDDDVSNDINDVTPPKEPVNFDTKIIDFKKINVEKALLVERLRDRVLSSRKKRKRIELETKDSPVGYKLPNMNWIVNRRLQKNYQRQIVAQERRKNIAADVSRLRNYERVHQRARNFKKQTEKLTTAEKPSKFHDEFEDLTMDELYLGNKSRTILQRPLKPTVRDIIIKPKSELPPKHGSINQPLEKNYTATQSQSTMGAYMSEPVKEKVSEEGKNDKYIYGATCMQGWRVNQEDAHNCILDFDKDCALFAVYDGHGGAEVSKYMSESFPEFLKKHPKWNENLVGTALQDSFIEFDQSLIEKEQIEMLKKIAGHSQDKEEDQESDGEDKAALLEEACLPLDQVLRKYGFVIEGGKKGGKTVRVQQKKGKSMLYQFLSPVVKSRSKSTIQDKGDIQLKEGEKMSDLDQSQHVEDEEEGPPSPPCSPIERDESGSKSNLKRKNYGLEGEDSNLDAPEIPDVKRTKPSEDESGKLPEPEPDSPLKPESRRCFSECAHTEDTPSIQQEKVAKSEVVESANKNESVKKSSPVKVSPQRQRSSKSESDAVVKEEGPVHVWSDVTTHKTNAPRTTGTPETATAASSSDEESDADADFNIKSEEQMDEEESMTDEDTSTSDGDSDDVDGLMEDGCVPEEEEQYPVPTGETPGVDSGTTACVAVLKGNKIFVANAGDSRCILCRDGVSVDLSVDHKPEDEVETNRIHKAGGNITQDGRVNGGLNLSRAIGDHFYKRTDNLPLKEQMISPEPDIRQEIITDKDQFMVIACDGIWNSMTSQEVVDFVKERMGKMSLTKICEQMCDACLADSTMGDGTGCDNMTVVIVELNSAQHNDIPLIDSSQKNE